MRSRRAIVGATLLAFIPVLWGFGYFTHRSDFGLFGVFPPAPFLLYVTLSLAGAAGAYVVLGGDHAKRRMRGCKVAALTLSVVFGMTIIELPALLQITDYRGVFGYNEGWDPIQNRIDPELISIHHARGKLQGQFTGAYVHTLGVSTGLQYDVDVRYDRNGFRNQEDLDAADLVVVGDSFVESPLVPFEELTSSLLARKLAVSVLNLGQSGYGPQQELITLKRYGLPVQPKTVVWMLYEGNDLEDYANYAKIMSDGFSDWAAKQNSIRKRSFTRNLLVWLNQITRRKAMFEHLGYSRQTLLRTPGEFEGKSMYFSHSRPELSSDLLPSLEGTQRCIGDACRLAQEAGSKFLLVFVPHKYRVYRDLVEPAPYSVVGKWQVDDLPDRMAKWARSHSISFIDLTRPLQRAARSGTLVFFLDDPHWNSKGNRVAAEEIVSFFRQQRWLPVTSGPSSGIRTEQ